MTVRFTPRSLRHLASIAEYIARDNPGASNRVIARILHSIQRVERFPLSARRGRVAGTRHLVVPGLPYAIIYRVTGSHVTILGVFHGARLQ